MEEPGDGSHASEIINYIVITEGEWAFPDGTEIKAGEILTDKNHQRPSVYDNWEQVSFNTSFFNPPVVLHSLNSYNNRAFKTSIVSDVFFSSFNIQQESAETGSPTEQEIIAWIAIESGKIGTINNVKYETLRENDGDNDGVDDNGHMFAFSFNQEEILFPNITLNDIKTKGYLRVSSKPPIREQVFSLIKRIRMDTSLKNVKDLINKVYYIRNKLFHVNYYLEDILESFRDKFNCPNFNGDDFIEISRNIR